MVFTQAALAQFFTAQDQMAIPEATRQQLALEGITSVGDFSEFDKDGVKQIPNNLQRTARRIPDLTLVLPFLLYRLSLERKANSDKSLHVRLQGTMKLSAVL